MQAGRESTVCGATMARHLTRERGAVECSRCLASLAKRDREFRAKARRGLTVGHPGHPLGMAIYRARGMPGDAAAAIAREEGQL